MSGKGARKKRGSVTYQKKVDRTTKWYLHLMECRKKEVETNPNTKLLAKRRELKELSYYIDKIKKPVAK